MLSTVPAFSFTEPGLVNQFLDFQTGFTPWELDCPDLYSMNQLPLEPAALSPCYGESDTGSVKINSGFHVMKTGSGESCAGFIKTKPETNITDGKLDEPDSSEPKHMIAIANFDSGEQKPNRDKLSQPEITDERKRKRMLSNRESAKRSRMRKQSHIDNLRNEVNRLDFENRELQNRLRLVLYRKQRRSGRKECNLVCRDFA